MNFFKVLKKQVYTHGKYSIVPIRMEDRHVIREWRNEQLYHLRQDRPLTEEDQNQYFRTIVASLFEEQEPKQVLFSYLENGECIGYGGLVHINWTDRNAEISFIMKTSLEKEKFEHHWTNFLGLIEKVAFKQLSLHKIYVYAFDLRPHLYDTLRANNYFRDAVLKEHCFFDGAFLDVVIHAKIKGV